MKIIITLYFYHGRWTKYEINETVASMSFNKNLKWALDSSSSAFRKHIHTHKHTRMGLAKKKKKSMFLKIPGG